MSLQKNLKRLRIAAERAAEPDLKIYDIVANDLPEDTGFYPASGYTLMLGPKDGDKRWGWRWRHEEFPEDDLALDGGVSGFADRVRLLAKQHGAYRDR